MWNWGGVDSVSGGGFWGKGNYGNLCGGRSA